MFEPTSRYFNLKTVRHETTDGSVLAYKQRRFVPHADGMPLLARVTVLAGDRPDLISARAFDDAEQFWRVCDANEVLDPQELTESPGRTVRIAAPQP